MPVRVHTDRSVETSDHRNYDRSEAPSVEWTDHVDGEPWVSWSRITGLPCCCPSRRTAWADEAIRGEFRQRVLDLIAAGRPVRDVALDLGISEQTVYTWRRQERVDQGIEPGLTSAEQAELAAARRRIRELEAELAIHRKAAELLKGTTSPKGDSRPLR